MTYADASVVEHEEERRNKPLFELAPQNMTVTERLGRLEATMNKVLNRLEYLDHHFEHHFLTLQVRGGSPLHPIASHRILSHPIASHHMPSYPIPSHPAACHRRVLILMSLCGPTFMVL